MPLDLKLQTKLTQQLVLTPQLQLSIKILQMNQLELKESISQEVQENPILDVREIAAVPEEPTNIGDLEFDKLIENYSKIREDFAAKDKFQVKSSGGEEEETSWEYFVTKKPNLYNHLLWQLHLESFTDQEIAIGDEIIGNIDPDGYLRINIDVVAEVTKSSREDVEKVLKRIQHFDPVGIASRDLKECLMNQFLVYDDSNAIVRIIIDKYLEDMSKKNFKKIAKEMCISVEEVEKCFELINSLNPKPGRGFEFSSYENQQIEPDVYVTKEGDEYVVTLNFDGVPYLKINRQYELLLKNKELDLQTKTFLQEKIKSAYWYIKSVHQRGSTILRVAKAIVERQKDFFDKGVSQMKPLTLRDLSEVLKLHESTISRVTSNKYMLTPLGLFEMKYFFGSGIRKIGGEDVASVTIKEIIRGLVENETPKAPLSDQEISDMLKAKGYSIARRTITKYRESLNILPSGLRKK